MKRPIKTFISILCVAVLAFGMTMPGYAHSGRTDGRGGHRDNRNVSGLGSYHYHCGGYPAHLHVSGYCPYTDTFPSRVSLKAEKTTLEMGESSSVSATVSPSNACSTSVTWESSDPSIVSVRNGAITAVGFGTATITASTFNDKVASIRITVKEIVADSIEITGFPEAVEGEENTMEIGETRTLGATILPEDVDNPTVTWTSSNPEVVSVVDGKIEALSEGTATITASSSNGKTDALVLNILEVVADKIEIEIPDTVTIGDRVELGVRYYPENTSYKDIEWKSSNDDIATVDVNGNLRAKDVGQVTITAVQKDAQDTVTIDIQPIEVESIAFSAPTEFEGQFGTGDTVQMTATVYPEDATYKTITWSSSNPEVATVDETGLVTAVSTGTAIISAVSGDGYEATIEVHVPSLLIPGILVCATILIVLAATIVIVRIAKKNRVAKASGLVLTDDQKRSQKKKHIILGSVGALAIVAVAISAWFFSASNKYDRAVFLAGSSRPMEAASLFEELGGFKDSKEQLQEMMAQDASLSIQFTDVGDEISYGHYEQDGDIANGQEPIEWIVLERTDSSAMLVSKYIIDAQPYVNIETDTGSKTLENWLNSTFIQNAFSDCNIAPIEDISLLTEDAMRTYSDYVSDPEWTQYALDQGPEHGMAAGIMWWLDGTFDFNHELHGPVVWENGSYSNNSMEAVKKAGVRPVLMIVF